MLHVGNGDKDTKKTSKGKTHWYFDLLDIMVDRASANAKTTSDELLDSDKDDISSNLSSSSSSSEKKQQNKRHLSVAKKTKTKQKETKTSKGGHNVGDHDYYDDDLLRPNYMNLIEELNNKKAQQYEEQIRHNQVMEDAVMWKAQNDKLEYKVNLIKKYGELKELGLSKTQIAKHFPEMMHLIEDDEDDDDDADVDA